MLYHQDSDTSLEANYERLGWDVGMGLRDDTLDASEIPRRCMSLQSLDIQANNVNQTSIIVFQPLIFRESK